MIQPLLSLTPRAIVPTIAPAAKVTQIKNTANIKQAITNEPILRIAPTAFVGEINNIIKLIRKYVAVAINAL